MKNSSYADLAETIKELTGRDCSKLTDHEMTQIGMAAEIAFCYWDWKDAVATEESSESDLIQIANSKEGICSVFEYSDIEPNEKDLVCAYVGGMWDEVVARD